LAEFCAVSKLDPASYTVHGALPTAHLIILTHYFIKEKGDMAANACYSWLQSAPALPQNK